ncbi:MAG: hypothetical protein KGL19_08820, partial [Bacteroidota bacterium]|nr:hypothetical protein [Bacteroidota bacterium]
MQGRFEKNIEQQLSNFSLEPSPQIWKDVEAALHPRQKRRGIFWWWVLLLGLLLGGGGWWFYNSTNETKININSTTIQNKKEINDDLIDDKNKHVENTPSTVQPQKNKTDNAVIETAGNNLIVRSIKAIDRKDTIQKAENNVVVKDAIHQNKITASTTSVVSTQVNNATNSKETAADTSKNLQQQNVNPTGSTNKELTITKDKNDSFAIPSSSNSFIRKGEKNKTDHWLITFGGGDLHTNQINLFPVTAAFYANVGSSNPGTVSNIGNQIAEASKGFNFFAG